MFLIYNTIARKYLSSFNEDIRKCIWVPTSGSGNPASFLDNAPLEFSLFVTARKAYNKIIAYYSAHSDYSTKELKEDFKIKRVKNREVISNYYLG